MTSETIHMGQGVREVDTGIANLIANKSGNVITIIINRLKLTDASTGWYTIGQLPNELKPSHIVYSIGNDNLVNSFSDNKALTIQISSSGYLSVYVFSDHRTFELIANITYLAD